MAICIHVLYTDHYITVHTVHNIVIINAGLLTHIIYTIKKIPKGTIARKIKLSSPNKTTTLTPPPQKKRGKFSFLLKYMQLK